MKNFVLTFTVVWLFAAIAAAQPVVTIDASKRGVEIPSTLYGIFFEEIRYAGDGGLYAELVRNRSFEDDHNENLNHWEGFKNGSLTLVKANSDGTNVINKVQRHAVKVVTNQNGAGILNLGYSGMNFVKGKDYTISLWAKGDADVSLSAQLMASDKTTMLAKVQVAESLSGEWKKYTATLSPAKSGERGVLAIVASKPTTFYLDVVSLFPPTFKDRPNGMRRDLAQMVADMKPAFMRFPGGCVVEGQFDKETGETCRVEWKKQLGGLEDRLGHRNNNWGYYTSDGLGVYEYFQFAEDIGAEPLYVFNIGMGHGWVNDYKNNEEFVQEALDLIEFANGDVTTPYGKVRAEMGHPAPFGLKYVEIGNEAHAPGEGDAIDHYADRYIEFYKAIKGKYPAMQIIGDGVWNGDDWNEPHPIDILDAHYYATPSFFYSNFNRYDTKDRSKYKYYIGEYAVTEDFGTVGNLNAALAEAVFMMGLERNGDVVSMASYAPMFCNDDYWGWWPTEMIHFNSTKSFGTPSYYVQKLFPNHLGTHNIDVTNNAKVTVAHSIGLVTWNTAVEASDIKITDTNTGLAIVTQSTIANADNWKTTGNQWTIGGGKLTQKDDASSNLRAILNKKFDSHHYSIEMTLTKTSGSEGFIIPFYWADDNNYSWFNIGGWGNTATALEQCIGGTKTTIGASVSMKINTGQAYNVKVDVDSLNATLYIDGKRIMVRKIKAHTAPAIYSTANINAAGDTIHLRLVNPYDYAQQTIIRLKEGYHITSIGGEYLGGIIGTAENTEASPRKVIPRPITQSETSANEFTYTVPRNSANFITIAISEGASAINNIQCDERLQPNKETSPRLYNLLGQRITSPGPNQVYVQSGKKILNNR